MVAIPNELNKQINVLFAGRQPVFRHQSIVTFSSAAPSSAGDGVDVAIDDGAVVALLGVRLRKNAGRFTMWLSIHNPDAAETYGIDFTDSGAGAYSVDNGSGEGDAATIMATLIAALEVKAEFLADGGTVAQLGTADILEISFPEATRSQTQRADTGALSGAFQSLTIEADFARWRIWGLTRSRGEWYVLPEREHTSAINEGQKLDLLRCNGYSRVNLQVIESDGAVLPFVAPGAIDNQADTAIQAAASGWTQHEDSGIWALSTPTGERPIMAQGWAHDDITVGVASILLSTGSRYVEILNNAGGNLFIALGRAATVNDFKVQNNGAWYLAAKPGELLPPIYGILSAGSGKVKVLAKGA